MSKLVFSALLMLCVMQAVEAAESIQRPIALNVPFESLWKSEAKLEIPVAPQVSSARVGAPALPRGKGLALRFQARLHTATPGGWNNFLAMRWNEVPVKDTTEEGPPRLLNRGRTFRSSIPTESIVPTFQERSGLPDLCVFFGPDFQTLDERVLSERDEGYWYLLDISDLDVSAPSRLDFVNTALSQYWGGKPPEGLRMIVENIEIGRVPEATIESLRTTRLTVRKPVKGPSLTVAGTEATLTPSGGLQFHRGHEWTWFESLYLAPQQSDGSAPWLAASAAQLSGRAIPVRIRRTRMSGSAWKQQQDKWLFEYQGKGFHLKREVSQSGSHLVVQDTVSNETDQDLGLRSRHRLLIPDFLKNFRLAGVEGQRSARPFGWADNPTLYVAQKVSGLGLLFQDDFFRLHMQGDAEANAITAADEHFGLAPKESYTFKLALYPTASDFWDFINAVRRDWKVNFTVQGPFEFITATGYQKPEDADGLRQRLSRKDLKIFALAPWFEYYSGYGITREKYEEMMQNAMRVIRSVKPDAICIPLTETNLIPVPLSFFQDKLPADFGWGYGHGGGEYGKESPPEAAAVVDASPWKDSVVRGEHGRPNLDTWYVEYYKEPKGLNFIVYPTLTNYRHKLMLEQLAWLLDDVGFDGVYIDQFAMALGGRDSLTYDVWDGHTVDLDPKTGEVTRKYAVVGKISAPARRAWVEFVLKRGKLVVANGEPVTSELQALPINRFMETQGYDVTGPGIPNATMCARGMLASPIGLGHSFGQLTKDNAGKGGEIFMRTVIAHLRYGLLYYYYGASFPAEEGGFGPVNHIFPFTPVELHEGYMIGKERIITCVSRTFAWRGTNAPKVLLFDKRGMEKPAQMKIEKAAGGYRVDVKLQDWVEVAVIE